MYFVREVVMLDSEQAGGGNLSTLHDTPWLAAVQMFLLCDVLFFFLRMETYHNLFQRLKTFN